MIFRELLYNIVPIINNTVLYTYNFVTRVDFKLSIFYHN